MQLYLLLLLHRTHSLTASFHRRVSNGVSTWPHGVAHSMPHTCLHLLVPASVVACARERNHLMHTVVHGIPGEMHFVICSFHAISGFCDQLLLLLRDLAHCLQCPMAVEDPPFGKHAASHGWLWSGPTCDKVPDKGSLLSHKGLRKSSPSCLVAP